MVVGGRRRGIETSFDADIHPGLLLIEINVLYIYICINAKTSWSGSRYRRIHFLPFTRDGRGYAQKTPFINLWNLMLLRALIFANFQHLIKKTYVACEVCQTVFASENSLVRASSALHQEVTSPIITFTKRDFEYCRVGRRENVKQALSSSNTRWLINVVDHSQ